MGAKAKPQPSELDHVRDTLTDSVGLAGETRSDVKALDRKVDAVDSKIDHFKQETRERFDKIEDTLTIIVNHLKK
ncbi:hypothetical protein [Endozoicomonas sp. 8E]|uniref:hypothetical protein n=1 Tax=Endozoicomonas sp. 8E TaxID=3035692 RepID=UPI002938F8BC|nr:hypothetical protein [Endozoicomonas sp. 8E]WOG28060.1 hypothetical protein P6910_26550 [Endozoicomonas sp. 8E]